MGWDASRCVHIVPCLKSHYIVANLFGGYGIWRHVTCPKAHYPAPVVHCRLFCSVHFMRLNRKTHNTNHTNQLKSNQSGIYTNSNPLSYFDFSFSFLFFSSSLSLILILILYCIKVVLLRQFGESDDVTDSDKIFLFICDLLLNNLIFEHSQPESSQTYSFCLRTSVDWNNEHPNMLFLFQKRKEAKNKKNKKQKN